MYLTGEIWRRDVGCNGGGNFTSHGHELEMISSDSYS